MRKYAAIGLSIFLSAALWAHSFMGGHEVSFDADTIVARVGDCDLTVSEVMIHFLNWRSEIESRWGSNMWNAQTGTNTDGTPITYEENIKDDIAQEIKVEKTLYQIAQKKNLTLTDQEKEACQTKAESLMRRFSNEDLITYAITEEKVTAYCEEMQLVEKLCSKQMPEVEFVITKNIKMTTIEGVLFPAYENDGQGNQIQVDTSTKKKIQKNAYAALKEIQTGVSIEEVAKEYKLDYAGEQTFLSSNLNGKQWEPVKALKDGETSEVLTMDQGYVIIRMVHKVDTEKMQAAKEQAVEKQKREIFEKYYEEKYKDEYRMKIEEDLWETLPLASEK
ncbi:MAG: hypothetical protein Q4D45_01370 [Lachnospiraceae bacterium]|nr:hypothetical protein [Lachnospiraceae bacterium]